MRWRGRNVPWLSILSRNSLQVSMQESPWTTWIVYRSHSKAPSIRSHSDVVSDGGQGIFYVCILGCVSNSVFEAVFNRIASIRSTTNCIRTTCGIWTWAYYKIHRRERIWYKIIGWGRLQESNLLSTSSYWAHLGAVEGFNEVHFHVFDRFAHKDITNGPCNKLRIIRFGWRCNVASLWTLLHLA